MKPPLRAAWLMALGLTLGLVALYWGPLRTGFLNDDYLFLEQARSRPLAESLGGLGALGNYYRPLSRQVYFAALGPLAGGNPTVFHAVNFAILLAALALLADLLAVALPAIAVLAGVLWFAVVPLQRVALLWISCSQDLLALAFALASLALHRRGRALAAAACTLGALFSKETALALLPALVAWDAIVARESRAAIARRLTPHAAVLLAWGAAEIAVHARAGHSPRFLDFSPPQFLAGAVHGVQSLLGLEVPSGILAGLASVGPALVPMLLLAPLAFLLPAAAPHAESARDAAPARGGSPARNVPPGRSASPAREVSAARAVPPARDVSPARFAGFAAVWLVAFLLVTGPVAHTWSSYYYLPAAAGAAAFVGLAARRLDRWGWPVFVAALLWWHAGATAPRAFAVRDDRWGWTSHLTSFYFERGADLTRTLARELRRIEPAPAHGTRFFFATLPPWAGFQMGNGAQVRTLYGDPTLVSHFYSEYSDSIAGTHPCRFLYWDGLALQPLYAGVAHPWFQVGGDLMLLQRPAGARDAFLRGLDEGGERSDLLYWLGWSELWSGRREHAEAAWRALGAEDDSLQWSEHLRKAHDALNERDTLRSRRELAAAVHFGIGRPEAHAVLGELLGADRSTPAMQKYAMLELSVAVWLKPADWIARRDLTLAFAAARLDDGAARELTALKPLYPEWREDSLLVALDRRLGGAGAAVAQFR